MLPRISPPRLSGILCEFAVACTAAIIPSAGLTGPCAGAAGLVSTATAALEVVSLVEERDSDAAACQAGIVATQLLVPGTVDDPVGDTVLGVLEFLFGEAGDLACGV
jgi:hypothetical protein